MDFFGAFLNSQAEEGKGLAASSREPNDVDPSTPQTVSSRSESTSPSELQSGLQSDPELSQESLVDEFADK
eukprot:g61932.t1